MCQRRVSSLSLQHGSIHITILSFLAINISRCPFIFLTNTTFQRSAQGNASARLESKRRSTETAVTERTTTSSQPPQPQPFSIDRHRTADRSGQQRGRRPRLAVDERPCTGLPRGAPLTNRTVKQFCN